MKQSDPSLRWAHMSSCWKYCALDHFMVQLQGIGMWMSANSVANKLYPNHISVLLNIHNMPHWLNNNFQNSGAAPQGKLEKFPFFLFIFFFLISPWKLVNIMWELIKAPHRCAYKEYHNIGFRKKENYQCYSVDKMQLIWSYGTHQSAARAQHHSSPTTDELQCLEHRS